MTDQVEQEKPEKLKKSSWWWPGVVASSLAGAAVGALRGCWHGKMGWPIGGQGYSYQVCLSCGAKRLFDEKTFSAYGPFRYDLEELTAWETSTKPNSHPEADEFQPRSGDTGKPGTSVPGSKVEQNRVPEDGTVVATQSRIARRLLGP